MRPTSFCIEKEYPGSIARAGVVNTPHGVIETPAFVAVATKATVKGVAPDTLQQLGIQAVITNTYHLFLSPGESTVEKAGGVGEFMRWQGPTMSDSGGFQVFSLGVGFGKKISKFSASPGKSGSLPAGQRGDGREPDFPGLVPAEENSFRRSRAPVHLSGEKSFPPLAVWSDELATSHGKLAIVDEEGVSFTSHVDGSFHRFTPERSVEIQHKLGADIIFAFDECTAPNADRDYQKEAMERTHRWAKKSLHAHRGNTEKNNVQGIYGIVQGGRFDDLRIESASELARMDFDGYGIGGSFSKHDLLGILDKVNVELPKDKPRHLLGIGEPEDLFIGVAAGCDTFDCVLPTRNGRSGTVYTTLGKINIENAQYKEDWGPLDPACGCPVCLQYTRGYIVHLFRTYEMLGPMLASQHNIYFLANLTKRIRESILDGRFE
ncbi:MAG: Queuine tRNA-ribosyltransferase, partial [Parcubacteria group bacterium GW2011_GWA2_50_10b]